METKALLYAEKHGIIDYTVEGSVMKYEKYVYGEGHYQIEYNLSTKKHVAVLKN
jgi:hypothetical protein